jgi:2-polyprenyl-3-methyl-5-hydroxy-6-metoxy-1,4-benzoquinol methylase
MDTIEINDDEIKSEEILAKIQENIRRRKESGSYLDPMPEILNRNTPEIILKGNETISKDLEYLTTNYEVNNKNYFISSHRHIIGDSLIKGRKMVNDEVKRYVDPVFVKQTELNACNARISRELMRKNGELNLKMEEFNQKMGEFNLKINEMNMKIEELNSKILEDDTKIEELNSTFSAEFSKKNIFKTSWGEYYNEDVTEGDLIGNINHHTHFISLIEEYAQKASNGIPKLLEVGLGTATMSIYFSRQQYDVLGIDNDINIIYNAIDTNKRLGGHANFVLIDANYLDILKNSSFDIAFSQGTLEHFGNDGIIRMLSKQLEVAKYVVFSVPSINYPKSEFGNERKMTIEDWEVILKSGGFNIVKIEYYREDTQIACIIQKKD